MSFEPKTLFPGMLFDSAARVAQDAKPDASGLYDTALIRDLGWNAVIIPEDRGGASGSFLDLGSIIEGLAAHAIALPVITRCAVIPEMLATLQGHDGPDALLTHIAEGVAVVELGGPLVTGDYVKPLQASREAQGWLVSGTTAEITLTDECTHILLVCVDTANGTPMLATVASETLHGHAQKFITVDDHRVTSYRLNNLALPEDSVLATGPGAVRALQAGWRAGVAATAIDTVCTMGLALARTIEYLLERKQFGQPLAQFQALRHDVARLYVTYELARGLLQASLGAVQMSPDDDSNVPTFHLLGLFTGHEAIQFAESVIQLHGGMGMALEMPAAQLATRLLTNALRYGDPLSHSHDLHNFRDGTFS